LKKTIQSGIDFLIHSNLFIAIAAAAQAALTYLLIQEEAQSYVLWLLFFSTLFIYNLSPVMKPMAEGQGMQPPRNHWLYTHKLVSRFLFILSIPGMALCLWYTSMPGLLCLGLLGVFSFFYAYPFIYVQGRKRNLREFPGLKLFLIGLVWAGSSVLFPLIESNADLSVRNTLILVFKRFLFVIAITIPFDIRDMYDDREYNLKTIPVMFGERASRYFCLLLMLLCLLLFSFYDLERSLPVYLGLSATMLLSAYLVFISSLKRSPYYYFVFLDGMLIAQYLIVLGCTRLW
jgi:4-hydroxybenzoate polyprenyltransferase